MKICKKKKTDSLCSHAVQCYYYWQYLTLVHNARVQSLSMQDVYLLIVVFTAHQLYDTLSLFLFNFYSILFEMYICIKYIIQCNNPKPRILITFFFYFIIKTDASVGSDLGLGCRLFRNLWEKA